MTPRIAITLGDPAGIGPEVTSLALRSDAATDAHFEVFGDRAALERAGGVPEGIVVHDHASAQVAPGSPDPAAAKGTVDAIETAARACLAGELDALVTGPISKEIMGEAGFDFPGHTELLERISAGSGGGGAVMLLAGGELRVALATIHCALREVPERLSIDGIAGVLATLHADLERRFGLSAPRIAVCGLNPHAGEAGRFGDEEARIIEPAVERARADGIDARGPLSADSLFHRAVEGKFDAVLGMYHDQALAPLKLHAFGRAVNVTLGLPLVRTSVDHGTAFDIAGQGSADPGSMQEAIALAIALVRNQRAFDGSPA